MDLDGPMTSAGTQKPGSGLAIQSFLTADWAWQPRRHSFGPTTGSFLDLGKPKTSAGTQKPGSSLAIQSLFPIDWAWQPRRHSFGPTLRSFLDLDGPMTSAETQKSVSAADVSINIVTKSSEACFGTIYDKKRRAQYKKVSTLQMNAECLLS